MDERLTNSERQTPNSGPDAYGPWVPEFFDFGPNARENKLVWEAEQRERFDCEDARWPPELKLLGIAMILQVVRRTSPTPS